MTIIFFFLISIIYSFVAFKLAKRRIIPSKIASLLAENSPSHYFGWCAAIWCFLILLITFSSWKLLITTNTSLYTDFIFITIVSLIVIIFSLLILNSKFRPRRHLNNIGKYSFMLSAILAVIITIFIMVSIFFEAFHFFKYVSIYDFLTGTNWHPQIDVVDKDYLKNSFGAVPVIWGTFFITIIAMTIAVPLGLYSAIYLSEFASKPTKNILKPTIEILAGIPTVVYGYFAVVVIAPFINKLSIILHIDIAYENALVAGIAIGVMIIPFIMSMSEDVLNSVSKSMIDASLAIGATRVETIKKVILPSSYAGLTAALLLAFSRAIGETMIVVMAAGLIAKLTINPLDSVTTVTAQIVSLLVGDQSFDSPKTLAAFSLGLLLFVITYLINIAAVVVTNRFRRKYG